MAQIKNNSMQHEVLKLTFIQPRTSADLFRGLSSGVKGTMTLTEFVTDITSIMALDGHVTYADGIWDITSLGADTKQRLDSDNLPRRVGAIAAKRSYAVAKGSYDGAELRDTCLRKGAYDFLALPSLFANTLVPHKTAALYA